MVSSDHQSYFSPVPHGGWFTALSVFSLAQSSQSPFFLSLSNQNYQLLMSSMTSSLVFLSLLLISLVIPGGLTAPLTSRGAEGNHVLPVPLP